MDNTELFNLFFNREESDLYIDSIEDEQLKEILKIAKYKIILRAFIKRNDNDSNQIPEQPFDLLFFTRIVHDLFKNKSVIKGILDNNYDKESW